MLLTIHFLFLEKEVIRKKYKKSQKQYLADYNLLVAKDLWQAHDQVLLIISLKEVIKLNVNTDTMKAKCKTCSVKYKDCQCFLEYTNKIKMFVL